MSNPFIQFHDVCFSYEKEMVLKHISMTVEEKSLVFVMGINGSGKTTLLKNFMGFLLPQSGYIQIDGNNVGTVDRHTMSRLVSYVPQAIHLNTDFTVMDYLSLGRTPHLRMVAKMNKTDFEIIDRYSEWLDVKQFYKVPFNKLSGGQKQMVAITRSLIQDTPLIVLDEPMSALDIGRQVDLLKILEKLVTDSKTIVLTTHNPNHALAVVGKSCFLKHGTIVSYGKSREVIQEGLLQKVYGKNITIDKGYLSNSVVFNMSNNGL